MVALRMEQSSIKQFMNKLLADNVFDMFEFRSAVVVMRIRFELSGRQNAEAEPVLWSEIRPVVFEIIKGNVRPGIFKLVLSQAPEKLKEIHADAKALFLNMTLEQESIIITTGCQTTAFTLDKSAEAQWDMYITDFLREAGIAVSVNN